MIRLFQPSLSVLSTLCVAVALLALFANSTQAESGLFHVSTTKELLEAVAKAQSKPGTIQLAPGVYSIDQPLIFRNARQVTLSGSGWNTIVHRTGDGNAIEIIDSGFMVVKDLLLQGSKDAENGSGIVFRGSSSCTVDFCRIDGFAESGVLYEGDPKTPMSSNTISRCHFIGNRKHQLHSISNNDFYILQNQFGTHSVSPQSGCWLDNSSAGTYSMNYHWGNVNALRIGPGAHFNRIQNNRFEESRETGVIIGEPEGNGGGVYNIISGNTFHTNSKGKPGEFPAVEAYDAAFITFTDNQAFSWDSATSRHKNSLVLGRGCSNWIVKDNILHHNTGKAIVYDPDASHIIKDNIVQDGDAE